jgi:hypothetical protein
MPAKQLHSTRSLSHCDPPENIPEGAEVNRTDPFCDSYNLDEVARRHRQLILVAIPKCALEWFGMWLLPLWYIALLLVAIVFLMFVIATIRLAAVVYENKWKGFAVALATFLPFIGFAMLVVLDDRVRKLLTTAGYDVKLLGALKHQS